MTQTRNLQIAHLIFGIVSGMLLLGTASPVWAGDTFVDWIAIDPSANTASGLLGSTSVTLSTDDAVPTAFGGEGVLTGVTNESSDAFADDQIFTPAIALTDNIGLGAASSFTLSFSTPLTNPTLHIFQLANNELSFTEGSAPLEFSLVSSDGNFGVVTATTIEGSPPSGPGSSPTDANGSIRFSGAITKISWTSDANNNGDGFRIQLSQANAPVMSCVGFEPPMAGGPVTVRGKRALPLKALLLDADGFEMTGFDLAAAPVVQILYDSGDGNAEDVSDDALPVGHGNDGNQFVYTDAAKWQFNLKTSNYTAPGTYTVFMDSGDAAEYVMNPTCVSEFVIK